MRRAFPLIVISTLLLVWWGWPHEEAPGPGMHGSAGGGADMIADSRGRSAGQAGLTGRPTHTLPHRAPKPSPTRSAPPSCALLNLDGTPLSAADASWLEAEDEPSWPSGHEPSNFQRERAEGEAALVSELSGPLVLERDPDQHWRLVRGSQLLAHGASPSGRPAALRIDVDAVRRSVGTLVIDVVRAETATPIPDVILEVTALDRHASAKVRFRKQPGEGDAQRPFHLRGIPEGSYEVSAYKVHGFGREWSRIAVATAEVRGERTTHLHIVLRPPARIPFDMQDPEGNPVRYPTTMIPFRDAHDRAYDLSLGHASVLGDGGAQTVALDAPAGHGWLVWRGNVREVWAKPGANAPIVWTVRDPVYVTVLVDAAPPPAGFRGLPVLARARTARGITVAEDTSPYDPDRDGVLPLSFELIPGTYTITWRLPTGAARTLPLHVPKSAEDTILVGLR